MVLWSMDPFIPRAAIAAPGPVSPRLVFPGDFVPDEQISSTEHRTRDPLRAYVDSAAMVPGYVFPNSFPCNVSEPLVCQNQTPPPSAAQWFP